MEEPLLEGDNVLPQMLSDTERSHDERKLILKSHFWRNENDLVSVCGEFSVFLSRLSSTSVTGVQCLCLMCCDVTGTVQFTFASRLLLIDLLAKVLKMNFRVNIFSVKKQKKLSRDPRSLPPTEAWPADRCYSLPNIVKTFQWGCCYSDTESRGAFSLPE